MGQRRVPEPPESMTGMIIENIPYGYDEKKYERKLYGNQARSFVILSSLASSVVEYL
jgi:hypothetical protein